jgi:mannose-6-phosphate isomerase-like protein (cupin superfamily)
MSDYGLKEFGQPDEVRTFPKGKLELVKFGGRTIGKFTMEPGWRWSECVKPAAGTDWCRNAHFHYQLSGRLHVILEDGTEFEAGPGSCVEIPAGHDAYVVGDEPYVAVDWQGALNYVRS